MNKNKITLRQLEEHLFNAADILRVSLNEMKFKRDLEVKKLEEFLERLGYVK